MSSFVRANKWRVETEIVLWLYCMNDMWMHRSFSWLTNAFLMPLYNRCNTGTLITICVSVVLPGFAVIYFYSSLLYCRYLYGTHLLSYYDWMEAVDLWVKFIHSFTSTYFILDYCSYARAGADRHPHESKHHRARNGIAGGRSRGCGATLEHRQHPHLGWHELRL